ncbi:MAG: hypothetical protein RRB13_03025 [bacterium]|nr:hypothetical protein [bacterium]
MSLKSGKNLLRIFFSVLLFLLLVASFVPSIEHKLKWELGRWNHPTQELVPDYPWAVDIYYPLLYSTEPVNIRDTVKQTKQNPFIVEGGRQFSFLGESVGYQVGMGKQNWLRLPTPKSSVPQNPDLETWTVGFVVNDFKYQDDNPYQLVFWAGDPDQINRPRHAIYVNAKDRYLHYASSLGGFHFKNIELESGKYYHVVISMSKRGDQYDESISLNGQRIKSFISQNEIVPLEDIFVGSPFPNVSSVNGIVNQVALWHVALSPPDVVQLAKWSIRHAKSDGEWLFLQFFRLLMVTGIYFMNFNVLFPSFFLRWRVWDHDISIIHANRHLGGITELSPLKDPKFLIDVVRDSAKWSVDQLKSRWKQAKSELLCWLRKMEEKRYQQIADQLGTGVTGQDPELLWVEVIRRKKPDFDPTNLSKQALFRHFVRSL